MQQHVGIAVADQVMVERHRHAPQAERPARRETVRVVADADALSRRGKVLLERVTWAVLGGTEVVPAASLLHEIAFS
jgi:hypothetical protein